MPRRGMREPAAEGGPVALCLVQDQRDEARVPIGASTAQLSTGCGGSLGAARHRRATPTTPLSLEWRRVPLPCLTIQPFSKVRDNPQRCRHDGCRERKFDPTRRVGDMGRFIVLLPHVGARLR